MIGTDIIAPMSATIVEIAVAKGRVACARIGLGSPT